MDIAELDAKSFGFFAHRRKTTIVCVGPPSDNDRLSRPRVENSEGFGATGQDS